MTSPASQARALLSCDNCKRNNRAGCSLVDTLNSTGSEASCGNCTRAHENCIKRSQEVGIFLDMEPLCQEIVPAKNSLAQDFWTTIITLVPKQPHLITIIDAYVRTYDYRRRQSWPNDAFRTSLQDVVLPLIAWRPDVADREDVSAMACATLLAGPLLIRMAMLNHGDEKFLKRATQIPYVLCAFWGKIYPAIKQSFAGSGNNAMLASVTNIVFNTHRHLPRNEERLHLTDAQAGALPPVRGLYNMIDQEVNNNAQVNRELKVFVKALYHIDFLVAATVSDNGPGLPHNHALRSLFTLFSHCVMSEDINVALNVRNENNQPARDCWYAIMCH
ncbi:hypothetical protein KCU93_g8444, partial [Aureobasidium melanogenum]